MTLMKDNAAASTTDTFFTTNPMDSFSPIAGGGPELFARDGEGGMDSARVSQLQEEAEMRAEHQAAARKTMLNLAEALEQAHARQRDLARLLEEERRKSLRLKSNCDRLEDELDEALLESEKRQADLLLRKGFESGNKLFLSMMLEKSRDAYATDVFHLEGKGKGEGDGEGQGEGAGAGAGVGAGEDDDANAAGGANWDSFLDKSNVSGIATGDKVRIGWMLKLWLKEAKAQREIDDREAAEKKRIQLEEERKRKMMEEVERRVAEVRKQAETLKKQLDSAYEIIEGDKNKMKRLEKKLEEAAAEAEERERKHAADLEKIKGELTDVKSTLSGREAELTKLNNDFSEAREASARASAEHDATMKTMQDSVRNISAELQESVTVAKFMKETVQKRSREASSGVSPAKFAQLIAQLEEMRDQLNALRKDYKEAKGSNADLVSKLEKNRRRLELERQFLPLIRGARGPLGPQPGTSAESMLAPIPYPDAARSPEVGGKKLQRSHSVSSHGGNSKGFSLAAVT